MRVNIPSLKNRKPSVYVYLTLYAFLGVLIIAESCFPSSSSGAQSNLFSRVMAEVVNFFSPPDVGKVIEPQALQLKGDSSFLTPVDGIPQIALGTTSRVDFQFTYPAKDDAKDSYDKAFTVTALNGKEGTDFALTRNFDSTNATVYVRINAKKSADTPFKIQVKGGGDCTATYDFKIVDLPAPTSYALTPFSSSTIELGKSARFELTLTDPRTGIAESEKKNDHELRRYFDPSKLAHTSSDPSVLQVDEFGVVHPLKTGKATASYGQYSQEFQILPQASSTIVPALNSLSLNASQSGVSLMDYDFFSSAEAPVLYEQYSTAVHASFSTLPSDSSLSFAITSGNALSAKIIPYRYERDSGKESWVDENGFPACRVQGYRVAGAITLSATCNANPEVKANLTLNVAGALAKTATFYLGATEAKDLALDVNAQLILTASFFPANTANTALHAVSDSPAILALTGDGTNTIVLTALKKGSATVHVNSLSNASLTSDFMITVTESGVISDANFNEFAQFMRKAAGHFGLFFVTALLGFLFFHAYIAESKRDYLGFLGGGFIGFLLAGFSELIQYFVPGRTASWSDVGIDVLGYLLGAAFLWGVFLLVGWLKNQRQHPLKKTPTN